MLPIGLTNNQLGFIVSLNNNYLYYKKLYSQYFFGLEKNKSNKKVEFTNIDLLSIYPFTSFIYSYKAGQIVQDINPDLISFGLSDPPFY